MVMAFVAAAIAMLIAMSPPGSCCTGGPDGGRGRVRVRHRGVVMVLALLAQGFQRSSLFELPVLLAILMFGGGLVFVRALERWL